MTIGGGLTNSTVLRAALGDWRIWIFLVQIAVSLVCQSLLVWRQAAGELYWPARRRLWGTALIHNSKNLLILGGVALPAYDINYMLAAAVVLGIDDYLLVQMVIREERDNEVSQLPDDTPDDHRNGDPAASAVPAA